ncbi:MAG: hypothetical protein ABW321_17540 [Polyangiales bacterium]
MVLALCAYACAGQSKIRHGDTLDVTTYPRDIQDAYQVFAVRCSRCHTLARPLNARIKDPQHWVRYVERMRLNPSSGINAKNGKTILRFLIFYMEERQKEERLGGVDALPPEEPASEAPPSAADPEPSERGDSAAPGQPTGAAVETLADPAKTVAEGEPEMNR